MQSIPQSTAHATELCTAIAVRPYTVRIADVAPQSAARKSKRTPRPRHAVARWDDPVLIFDTETSTDAAQRLQFGSYRYCRWHGAELRCVEEGLFVADELATENPTGYADIAAYALAHELPCMTRRQFVTNVFFRSACGASAMVVGFNLPFDISRIAVDSGEARGRHYGGFSFVLADYYDEETASWREDRYFARVCVKHRDSTGSFIAFTGGQEPHKGKEMQGRFLDLKTLAFALTNTGHSLASACHAFAVEHGKSIADKHGVISAAYLDYNRRDVLATQELLVALRTEFDRHPIALDPCRAYSPASISKAYKRALGVTPPAQQFATITDDIRGIAMSGYFGGRAEVRIRRAAVPVVYTDFLSMYPTVNALLGLWHLLTAESVDIVDATDDVRALLATMTPDACFRRETWPQLLFFAQIIPDHDVLPVRARYSAASDTRNIGINELTATFPIWYAGPDVVASTLATGRPSRVERAWRLVPRGQQRTLTPLRLGGAIPVDPRCTDFFSTVIEQRKSLNSKMEVDADTRERIGQFLKVLANAGSYGVFAQMDVDDLRQGETVDVQVYGADTSFRCATPAPEMPGPYCFPPMAALIPAAARLMLGLLERCVVEASGQFALCDTDSMAIVATKDGGVVPCPGGALRTADGVSGIRALSWHEVDGIVHRFAQLSPYDPRIVSGSILKIERENFDGDGRRRQLYAYGISAKRYALFERSDAGINVVKQSEHGLGHLLNPTDPDSEDREWIGQVWHWLICGELGLPRPELPWLDRPAISRAMVSAPSLHRPFDSATLSYRERVKPMNFMLSAHVAPCGHPAGTDPTHFHLFAPYERDPRRWLRVKWADAYSRKRYAISTADFVPAGVVRVQAYRDVLDYYATHPEPKSAAASGAACDRTTVGLLGRRMVTAVGVEYVGKESNRMDDVEHGLVHDWDEVQSCYVDEASEWRDVLLPKLREMPRAEAARRLAISERAVASLRNGHSQPRPATRRRLRALSSATRSG